MSLWRKRNVHYNGQNQPKLFKMTAMTYKDLSIKSDDLSIKSWVGLTDEEMMDAIYCDDTPMERGRRVEAKLRERNT